MKKKCKVLLGKVISNKMDKTIIVSVDRKIKHFLYGKFIVRSTKYYVHDKFNECNVGDFVNIYESRPISKLKKWSLFSVIKK